MNRLLFTTMVLVGVATSASALADYPTTVFTPNGTAVASVKMTDELSNIEITALNNYVASTYPGAVRETNASRKYNCHSYAWHNQSGSNDIWINSPGDDKYWNDGSHPFITSANGGVLPISGIVPNGAKVSYGLADHSAIKVNSMNYRSKWGQYPRMLHQPGYCPYACMGCSFTVSYYQ